MSRLADSHQSGDESADTEHPLKPDKEEEGHIVPIKINK